MEYRTHYEIYRNSSNDIGILARDKSGLVVNRMEGLPDDFRRVENLVTLYNANHLMPEHFPEVTEQLLGILL